MDSQSLKLIPSPWHIDFDSLVDRAVSTLMISSPYVGKWPCDRILSLKPKSKQRSQFAVYLITDLSRDTLLSGATDVSAVCELVRAFPKMEVRFIPSIHAKVYVADEELAVVTSGNMTRSGLVTNFEYGVEVSDRSLVRRIRRDIAEYGALGTRILCDQLEMLSRVSQELRDMRISINRSVRQRLRLEFERRLSRLDEEIIRVRAAGRAPHAIFADAMRYLLRAHPMATIELHHLIQKIHPDLCDDTIDRVIDGKHFGKKWKHAVRTAQQHLKRTGEIELRDGLWCLKNP